MKNAAGLWAGLVLLATLVPTIALAYGGSDNLGAAFRFTRYQTDFGIGTNTYDVRLSEVGLATRQYFGPDFALSMEAGYAASSYDHNPAAAKFSPSGAYGRLGARYQWWIVRHFALDFKGTAAYHHLTNSNASGSFADHWWSYSAAAGPRYSIRWFSVAAGVVYRHASGEEQSPSAGTQSLEFARTTNPYLDFDFTVTPHGTFGVHLEGGARQSIALVFGYRYMSP